MQRRAFLGGAAALLGGDALAAAPAPRKLKPGMAAPLFQRAGLDGKTVDLNGGGLKEQLTRQVCDKILSQAKSFL